VDLGSTIVLQDFLMDIRWCVVSYLFEHFIRPVEIAKATALDMHFSPIKNPAQQRTCRFRPLKTSALKSAGF
jgi:hypothetical protein